MYSIMWFVSGTSNPLNNVVGEMSSIMAVANLLEKSKQLFRVYTCTGIELSQNSAGVGGFEYWQYG